MIFPHTVTFQQPTASQLPSGQEVRSYAPVGDLTDLPARVVPVPFGSGDQAADRMVLERDLYTIVVQGDRLVERDMRAVTSHVADELHVIRVQRPVLYRSPQTYTTLVTVERVSASAGGGES